MADPQIVQLADAIVTDLDAATLSVAFTPVRTFVPITSHEALSSILVEVVPVSEVAVRSSRANWQNDYTLNIGVRKQVGNDTAAVAALLRLAEEIFDYYRTTTPSGRTDVLMSRAWLQMIAFEGLEERREFGSFQTLTFRSFRDS